MTSFKAYKKELSINSSIDLQTIYDGDANGGDAIITTNATDGSVVIAGTESLSVTATNGVSITNALTLSNKTSGSVLFAGAAGLVQQDNANLFWDDTNNRLGIGSGFPTSLFSVGAGLISQFQIDANGNILRINDVPTSFPSVQGAASSYLVNDGAGNLTWGSPRASQLELDTTQGSLGAAIDGSGAWLGFSGTNYLDAELTITSSLIKLDTQLASTTAWLVKDANYTASSGDKILADTNNIGAFTITLPSSPTPGMEVSVVDAANTWGTANLTINSGAENIAGGASPFVFNVTAEVWGRFVYFNLARGWVLST